MALFNQASKVTNSRPSGIKSVEIPYCFLCRGSGRKKIRHKSRPLFRFYFKLVHPNEKQNCYLNFTVNYGFVRHLQKSAICDFAGKCYPSNYNINNCLSLGHHIKYYLHQTVSTSYYLNSQVF